MKHLKLHLSLIIALTAISSDPLLFGQTGARQKPDPATTEIWAPVPEKVFPDGKSILPSDAIVLFDGTNLDAWEDTNGGRARWPVSNGIATVAADSGSIRTKQTFGDCQLHVEWRIAPDITGEGQLRGNSGIVIQERYEVQVLESFEGLTYVNGQAGAIYKQYAPLVNACKKPGEWQSYDIIFTAPRFNEKGQVVVKARMTILQNGVLIQNNSELWGTIQFTGLPKYVKHDLKVPLMIQNHPNNHLNPVQYKFIWIREL